MPEYRIEFLVGVWKVLDCGIEGLESVDRGMGGEPWPVYLRWISVRLKIACDRED